MIIDLFAGPGGWDQGLRDAGHPDTHGVELDQGACLVAQAAGHARTRCDVYGADPRDFAGETVDAVASPPCGGIAPSGKRVGRADLDDVLELLECIAGPDWPTCDCRADYLMRMRDHRSILMAEPMRWVRETDARSLMLEQAEAALPVWEAYVEHLTAAGWWAEARVLNASDYGSLNDRRRAVLVAHRDRPVRIPTPHGPRESAAAVLGPGVLGFPRLNDRPDGGKYRARDMRPTVSGPSFTVTSKARSWTFVPDGADTGRPLTVSEAGQLQTFPADYPWDAAGVSRSDQFLMVANAVPPAFAAALAKEVLG